MASLELNSDNNEVLEIMGIHIRNLAVLNLACWWHSMFGKSGEIMVVTKEVIMAVTDTTSLHVDRWPFQLFMRVFLLSKFNGLHGRLFFQHVLDVMLGAPFAF